MNMNKAIVVGLLVWAILASSIAAYYYNNYVTEMKLVDSYRSLVGKYMIKVSILIEYGNGSKLWYNDTLIPIGFTVLNATMSVAKVKYTIGNYGAFVTSINGVENNKEKNLYWIYWVWKDGKWVPGSVASDKYVLQDGEMFAWTYSNTASWPPPPP